MAIDPENRHLVDLAARFSRGFLRSLDGGCRGDYARMRVLELLHCQSAQQMGALADAVGVTARNLTAVADALEREGLVRRTAHPTDRRATNLEITPAGIAVAEDALAPRFAAVIGVFAELTPIARDHFAKSLAILVEKLEE